MSLEEDPQREINQLERRQFVEAVNALEEQLEDDIPESVFIELYGPENERSDELKEELRREKEEVGYQKHALFDISGTGLFVYKTEAGSILENSAHSITRGKLRWIATSVHFEKTEEADISYTRTHEVGQSSNLPLNAWFNERQKLKNAEGIYEGYKSEAELQAKEKFDEERQDKKIWIPPSMGEYLRVIEEQIEKSKELEEMTGILPNLFTKERFDRIMQLLKQAGPNNLQPRF